MGQAGARLKSGLKLQRCTKKTEVCPKNDGLHFFPGDELLIFLKGGAVAGQWPARGGPSETKPGGKLPADPTTAGEYRLLEPDAYHSPTWPFSRIPWGTPLQDHPEKDDVYYQVKRKKDGSSVWASVKSDHMLTRKAIIDQEERVYGARSVPPSWNLNDFGPKAFRYYLDVNHNEKFDPGVDKLMPEMIHTTPNDEAAKGQGKQQPLGESHGCVHVQPSDRDTMQKVGALKAGTPFIVHGYKETYKCP
jgi:hypothetical protein